MVSSEWTQEAYLAAWQFASQAHEGQTYTIADSQKPVAYIYHIGGVAMEVIWALSCTESLDGDLAVQCALLHDVVEDTPMTLADVVDEFGHAVADGVSALTKNETLPTKREQMLDSLSRIQVQPPEIWLVKLADRIVNLSPPPPHWGREKVVAYQDEARLIYAKLGSASRLLARRLADRIEAYSLYIS